MADEIYVLLAVGVWWTLAVVIITQGVDSFSEWVDRKAAFATAIMWPIFLTFYGIVLIWQAFYRTPEQMRKDIRNAGQWREYQDWLKERGERNDT